jgi:hypothetical protein
MGNNQWARKLVWKERNGQTFWEIRGAVCEISSSSESYELMLPASDNARKRAGKSPPGANGAVDDDVRFLDVQEQEDFIRKMRVRNAKVNGLFAIVLCALALILASLYFTFFIVNMTNPFGIDLHYYFAEVAPGEKTDELAINPGLGVGAKGSSYMAFIDLVTSLCFVLTAAFTYFKEGRNYVFLAAIATAFLPLTYWPICLSRFHERYGFFPYFLAWLPIFPMCFVLLLRQVVRWIENTDQKIDQLEQCKYDYKKA